MAKKPTDSERRDDVLRTMLRRPPTPHKPLGKRKTERLAELIESDDPENFEEIAKELGQDKSS
jgi:hypothetical protein